MKILIIQENGIDPKERHMRECHSLKYWFNTLGVEAECWGKGHDTFNKPQNADKCDDCGSDLVRREDDKPEAVRNRLKVYATQTTPVLDHYREAGNLVEVDGEQSIYAVQEDLAAAVG